MRGDPSSPRNETNLDDFLNVFVVVEVDERVAEEAEDVAGEELDSGLAANLVHADEDVLARAVGDDDDVELVLEELGRFFSLKLIICS